MLSTIKGREARGKRKFPLPANDDFDLLSYVNMLGKRVGHVLSRRLERGNCEALQAQALLTKRFLMKVVKVDFVVSSVINNYFFDGVDAGRTISSQTCNGEEKLTVIKTLFSNATEMLDFLSQRTDLLWQTSATDPHGSIYTNFFLPYGYFEPEKFCDFNSTLFKVNKRRLDSATKTTELPPLFLAGRSDTENDRYLQFETDEKRYKTLVFIVDVLHFKKDKSYIYVVFMPDAEAEEIEVIGNLMMRGHKGLVPLTAITISESLFPYTYVKFREDNLASGHFGFRPFTIKDGYLQKTVVNLRKIQRPPKKNRATPLVVVELMQMVAVRVWTMMVEFLLTCLMMNRKPVKKLHQPCWLELQFWKMSW